MTEFTPTTTRVRTGYASSKWAQLEQAPSEAKVEFDRWLAEVVTQERERIRANIIDRVKDLSSCHKNDNCEELGALIASYIEEWIDTE